jgi:hypothetical protein
VLYSYVTYDQNLRLIFDRKSPKEDFEKHKNM